MNEELITGKGFGWIGPKIPDSLSWNKYIIQAYIVLTIPGCQSGISFHINNEYSNEIFYGISHQYIIVHDYGNSIIYNDTKSFTMNEGIKLTIIVDDSVYKLYINDILWRELTTNYPGGSIGLRSDGTCDDGNTIYTDISVDVFNETESIEAALNTTLNQIIYSEFNIIPTSGIQPKSLNFFGLPSWIFEIILSLIGIIILLECCFACLLLYYCWVQLKLKHTTNVNNHANTINHNRGPSNAITHSNPNKSIESLNIIYDDEPSLNTVGNETIPDNATTIGNATTIENTITCNTSKNATTGETITQEVVIMTRSQYCQL